MSSNYIFCDKKLVHVVRDFRPWEVMTKVRYVFMVQIEMIELVGGGHFSSRNSLRLVKYGVHLVGSQNKID